MNGITDHLKERKRLNEMLISTPFTPRRGGGNDKYNSLRPS